jgi:hypothetical protein
MTPFARTLRELAAATLVPLSAALLLTAPPGALAHPVSIDFEAPQFAADTLVAPGGAFTLGLLSFQIGGNAFGSALTSASFDPQQSSAPPPPRFNDTQYLGLFGDGFLTITGAGGNSFAIQSFDLAYLAPLPFQFGPGEVPGLLLLGWGLDSGESDLLLLDLNAADANGEFGFASLGGDTLAVLARGGLSFLQIGVCTFSGGGNCSIQNANFSQFAIDNLVGSVPLPGTLALALLGLAALRPNPRRA